MIIITRHVYGNTRHNTLTLLKVDFQVDVIPLADSHRMRVFSCFLQLLPHSVFTKCTRRGRHGHDTSRDHPTGHLRDPHEVGQTDPLGSPR